MFFVILSLVGLDDIFILWTYYISESNNMRSFIIADKIIHILLIRIFCSGEKIYRLRTYTLCGRITILCTCICTPCYCCEEKMTLYIRRMVDVFSATLWIFELKKNKNREKIPREFDPLLNVQRTEKLCSATIKRRVGMMEREKLFSVQYVGLFCG